MKITTTFHAKTDENTWVPRMRRNTFPHAEARCSVDAGHAQGIDLDCREDTDCRNRWSIGQHEAKVISVYEL